LTVDVLYTLLIASIGAFICYDDLKRGLIKNKYLFVLILSGIVYFLFNAGYLNLYAFAISMCSAIFLGVFLWLIDIWPAADGKFFIILSFDLFPLLNFSEIGYALIINTCVPFFFIYSLSIILKSERKKIKEALKYAFDLYRIFMITIVLLGFTGFIIDLLSYIGLFSYIGIIGNIFLTLILIFFAMDVLMRILPINLEPFFLLCSILRLIIAYHYIYTLDYVIYFISMILIFIFFRYFILKLTFERETYPVNMLDLKPGMKLAEGILERGNHYEKVRFLHFDFFDFMMQKTQKFIHEIGESGITKENIENIKTLYKEKKLPFDKILVYESISFAIFIFAGFLITILLKGDVISLIRYLFLKQ